MTWFPQNPSQTLFAPDLVVEGFQPSDQNPSQTLFAPDLVVEGFQPSDPGRSHNYFMIYNIGLVLDHVQKNLKIQGRCIIQTTYAERVCNYFTK